MRNLVLVIHERNRKIRLYQHTYSKQRKLIRLVYSGSTLPDQLVSFLHKQSPLTPSFAGPERNACSEQPRCGVSVPDPYQLPDPFCTCARIRHVGPLGAATWQSTACFTRGFIIYRTCLFLPNLYHSYANILRCFLLLCGFSYRVCQRLRGVCLYCSMMLFFFFT